MQGRVRVGWETSAKRNHLSWNHRSVASGALNPFARHQLWLISSKQSLWLINQSCYPALKLNKKQKKFGDGIISPVRMKGLPCCCPARRALSAACGYHSSLLFIHVVVKLNRVDCEIHCGFPLCSPWVHDVSAPVWQHGLHPLKKTCWPWNTCGDLLTSSSRLLDLNSFPALRSG